MPYFLKGSRNHRQMQDSAGNISLVLDEAKFQRITSEEHFRLAGSRRFAGLRTISS
jgi:hypothetical protein